MESKHKTSTSQVSPNPGVKTGDGHEVPPIAEEPLSCDGCWEAKGQFSSGMQTLRAVLVSIDDPPFMHMLGA